MLPDMRQESENHTSESIQRVLASEPDVHSYVDGDGGGGDVDRCQ